MFMGMQGLVKQAEVLEQSSPVSPVGDAGADSSKPPTESILYTRGEQTHHFCLILQVSAVDDQSRAQLEERKCPQ